MADGPFCMIHITVYCCGLMILLVGISSSAKQKQTNNALL
jgi:hypothetical protein